jgi:hypothetical protein
MTRPRLNPIPLADVLPLGSRRAIVVTMSPGQWDTLLAGMYESGAVLLELDSDEQPIRAYQRRDGAAQ